LNFKNDPLTNLEVTQTRAFNGGPINKNIGTTIVGMNVAATLFNVEPPDCSDLHGPSSSVVGGQFAMRADVTLAGLLLFQMEVGENTIQVDRELHYPKAPFSSA
jgi:hypothetical protein